MIKKRRNLGKHAAPPQRWMSGIPRQGLATSRSSTTHKAFATNVPSTNKNILGIAGSRNMNLLFFFPNLA